MNTYILEYSDRSVGINYFLDYSKGVIVDLSKCIESEKFMLSEAKYLCDNITSLKEKDNNYYIGRSKYLTKSETRKFLDESFDELGKGLLKNRTYLCLAHHGKYKNRIKTYKELLETIKLNNYKIVGIPIEQYIVGSWNQEDENKYVTNIMIPIDIQNI